MKPKKRKRLNATSDSIVIDSTPIDSRKSFAISSTPIDPRKSPAFGSTSVESRMLSPFVQEEKEIFQDSPSPSFETSVRQILQTYQGRDTLNSRLGPLRQRYVGALLSGSRNTGINHVYVYLNDSDTMLDDKRFDVDSDDSVSGIHSPCLYLRP